MDVGAFVQENKRWLLGCALGLVVFFVARSVIASVHDPQSIRMQAVNTARQLPERVYDDEARRAAAQEQDQLRAERQRLQRELGFVQSAAYLLENQSMTPDVYLSTIGRQLRLSIQQAASEREVEILDGERGLSWPNDLNPDVIRRILFGLELLDTAAQRLFAAHDAVRAQDPQAMGLVGMKLWLDPRARPPRRGGREAEADLEDLFARETVHFEFHADAATAMRFLESLCQPGRALLLEGKLVMKQGQQRAGAPLTVQGVAAGIAFREQE